MRYSSRAHIGQTTLDWMNIEIFYNAARSSNKVSPRYMDIFMYKFSFSTHSNLSPHLAHGQGMIPGMTGGGHLAANRAPVAAGFL